MLGTIILLTGNESWCELCGNLAAAINPNREVIYYEHVR